MHTAVSTSAVVTLCVASLSFSGHAAPGDRDISFGDGGTVIVSPGDSVSDIAIQADGKIIMTGHGGFQAVRYLPNGTLDLDFGENGTASALLAGTNYKAKQVAIQDDGKILLAGYARNGALNYDIALLRYHPDGSLDTQFNGTGILMAGTAVKNEYARDLLVQSDGKILVAGYAARDNGPVISPLPPAPGNDAAVILMRFNSNGVLDTTFGAAGIVSTNRTTGDDRAGAVTLQTDGKILVAGNSVSTASDHVVMRYHSDGALDVSFNGTGTVVTDFGGLREHATGVAVQGDGKILAAGYSGSGSDDVCTLVRYLPNGTPEATFGSGGKVTSMIGGELDRSTSLLLLNDGKILAAGAAKSGGFWKFALIRYRANGSLDPLFGAGGKVITAVGASNDFIFSSALQCDSKIVAAGYSVEDSTVRAAAVRYLGDSPSAQPQIVVEQPAGRCLADGRTDLGFGGKLAFSGSVTKSFTVKNVGGSGLTGLAVTREGPEASEFVVDTSGMSPGLSPDSITSFSVTFIPSGTGTRHALLHIASNDADENPFEVFLTGRGLIPIENWRQTWFGAPENAGTAADSSDPNGNGIPNLLEYAFGGNPSGRSDSTILPEAHVTGEDFEITFAQPAGVSGITYGAEWSATLNPGTWIDISDTGTAPQHTFNVPMTGRTRAFIRLKVSDP